VSTAGGTEPTLALAKCYQRWRAELLRRGAVDAAGAVDRRAAEDPFLRAAR